MARAGAEGRLRRFAALAVLLWAAVALPAAADDSIIFGGNVSDDGDGPPPKEQPEAPVKLPAVPKSGGWVRVALDLPDYGYSVSIAPDSLQVIAGRAVRYVVALVSGSGARNLFYEAVRCDGRYRRYAYAGSDGRFHPVPEMKWKRISRHGVGRYRYPLARDFLCNADFGARSSREIRQAIRDASD